MGLDNSTLFVANIIILLVSVAACCGVWLRSRADRHWLSWICANLLLAGALLIYLGAPDLPPHLAVWPDALLIGGFSLRLAAARQFGGRSIGSVLVWAPAPAFVALALTLALPSANYTLANMVLTAQALLVALEFWRGRGDRIVSRFGLIGAYLVMAVSFAARALQGLVAAEQISSYIPYDDVLEAHLVVALLHVAAGSLLVLSLASERSADALRRAAMRDHLTGLNNRGAFDEHLRLHLGSGSVDFALVLLDVDHFKTINDRYGHAAGDRVLRTLAQLLMYNLREHDFVARIGGEEFAVILYAVEPDQAFALTEQLRRAIGASVTQCPEQSIKVTVSAGICHARAAERDYDRLLEAADRELYRAKEGGRDKTVQRPLGGRRSEAAGELVPEREQFTGRGPIQLMPNLVSR